MPNRRPCFVVATLLVFGFGATAFAQTPRVSRGYVGATGGLNHEQAEDGLQGTTGAAGVVAGFSVTNDWTVEAGFWMPGFLRDQAGSPAHRDMLLSVAAVRFFGQRAVRPFLLAGVSVARTEDRLTSCIAERVPFGGSVSVPTIVDRSSADVIDRRNERIRSTSSYAMGGAGLALRVAPRVQIAPDVRFDVAATSFIVRPSVAVSFLF